LLTALGATAILLIPLVAMQFSNEVTWDTADFVIAWVLLFGTGITYFFISSAMSENIKYKLAVALAVAANLLMIWVNLAVGIIGNEENPANLMYLAVPAAGIIGLFFSRLKPMGMYLTSIFMAIIVVIIAIITIVADLGFTPIISAFFAILFLGSALLFKDASREQEEKTSP
ncbi:MAG: hypothetical protein MI700_05740, partial [Balneolales bacterium]|nr:hypothetical protein [Balneolales bacterium]